jgi:hypothetical protein
MTVRYDLTGLGEDRTERKEIPCKCEVCHGKT